MKNLILSGLLATASLFSVEILDLDVIAYDEMMLQIELLGSKTGIELGETPRAAAATAASSSGMRRH